MTPLPIPQGIYPDFHALDPKRLAQKGIRLVLADLDNTLVAYGVTLPTPEVIAWKNALKEEGITLYILSNSRRAGRVETFANALNVPYQGWSGKPKKKGYRSALLKTGFTPQQTVMVGDQIFTDILGATRMGITPLLLEPIQLAGNPGRYVRYYLLEAPFRSAGRNRTFFSEY